MDTIDRYNYERVKWSILNAYELVPDAYRQSFRSLKKQDSQTYVEYVRNKERLFKKWCKSRQIDTLVSLKSISNGGLQR